MNARLSSLLAGCLLGLCLTVEVVAVWVQALNDPRGLADDVASAVMLLIVAGVGTLVASRQPRNPIGWLFVVSVLIQQIGVVGLEWSIYALVTSRHPFPGALAVGVIGGVMRGVGWLLLPTFLLLLFPDGRLPSRRWRPVGWFATGALVYYGLETVFGDDIGDIDQRLIGFHNPLAVIGPNLTGLLEGLYFLMFLSLIGTCMAAVVVRFRRSRGQERQQLKWFTYAAAICLLVFLGIVFSVFFTTLNVPGIAFYLAIIGLPVGAGIAILRYRLYDIDLIINRTLVYGSLTVILAAIYFVCVLGAQSATRALTGQVQSNPIVIVLSTLLIAALFTPLRRGIQRGIDRRFYRAKYDAARTLAAFGAVLRQDVDLAELREHLLGVVKETMQPTHVSLWLRSTGSEGSRRP